MSKNNNAPKFALGAVIAAGAGYLAGLLTAPKSGKDTRKDIKESANKAINETEKQLKKLHTDLGEAVDQARTRGLKLSDKAKAELDTLVSSANDHKQKARELLSGIHEGEADDKDLQKAIKEAQKAVDHLKNYLKK